MEVVSGSTNEPKQRAIEEAFKLIFPDQKISLKGVKTEPGVSDHPISSEESIQGALNRARDARQQLPGADFYVGIEGGWLKSGKVALEIGWVAVLDSTGQTSLGTSPGLEIKGRMLEAIENGQDLNAYMSENFDIEDIGDREGFYGLMTDGHLNREQAYTQGVIMALAGLNHPEYFE